MCNDCDDPIGIVSVPGRPPHSQAWHNIKAKMEKAGVNASFLLCDCCNVPMGLVSSEVSMGDEGEHIVH